MTSKELKSDVKYLEKWRVVIVDKMTRRNLDGQYYLVRDMDNLKELIDELLEKFKRVKITEDDIEIVTKFINYVKTEETN